MGSLGGGCDDLRFGSLANGAVMHCDGFSDLVLLLEAVMLCAWICFFWVDFVHGFVWLVFVLDLVTSRLG